MTATAAISYTYSELLPAELHIETSLDQLRVGIGPGASRGADLAFLATMRTDQSRASMARALEAVALVLSAGAASDPDWVAWHEVTNAHAQAVAATLANRHAPSTANHRLAALRGVLKAAWRAGLMDSEAYHRAVDIAPIRGSRAQAGRALDTAELLALFESCAKDQTLAGPRDAAVLALLAGVGLRRTETCDLNFAAVDLEAGEVRCIGKGNKERVMPISGGTLAALRDWVAIRGDAPGPFVVGITPARTLSNEPLSGDGLLRICKRRAKRAGVSAFTPHDLRRTFCSSALDRGADISAVQGLMGHSSVNTTQRYDRRGERAMRKAAELVFLPYVEREARTL